MATIPVPTFQGYFQVLLLEPSKIPSRFPFEERISNELGEKLDDQYKIDVE